MQPLLSAKFRFWSFVSMVLLVFVHGYNLNVRYLQPWTIVQEHLTFTTFIEYLFCNGLLRFRIPMLFIISGYLFAMHDYKPYGERANKRTRTLLLPYLLWSAIAIFITYLMELYQLTKELVASTGLMQLSEQRRNLGDYQWWEVLLRWIFAPIPFQLWFIRVLLIYNLAYPAIRWCVLKGKWFYFGPVIFLWLTTFGLPILEGEGLLFFSLGVLLQKKEINLLTPPRWLRPLPWFIVFLSFSIIKTILAFKLTPDSPYAAYAAMTMMHKLVVFAGLIAAWYGSDAIVRWFMSKSWFTYASAFSFIIYALHAPLITYAIQWLLMTLAEVPYYRAIIFVLLPTAVILLSIATGALLRKTVPVFYGLLTGGRGMRTPKDQHV